MDLDTIKHIFSDGLAATSLAAMATAAGVDVLAGTYEALASGTFKFTLFSGFLETKVLKGILPVLVMYVASLGLADPFKTSLSGAAALGAAAFIAAQTASVYGHFKVKPPEDVVPPEDPVPPEVAKA